MDIKKPWLISAIATCLIGGGFAGIGVFIAQALIIPAVVSGGLIVGGVTLKYFQKDIEEKYHVHILKIQEVMEITGLDEEIVKEILERILGELIEESIKIE